MFEDIDPDLREIKLTPIQRWARMVGDNLFLRTEVAAELGTTPQRLSDLARYRRSLRPSVIAWYGKQETHLYTLDDIEILRAWLDTHSRVGRPRVWAPEQRQQRIRIYTLIKYYRRRIADLAERGEPTETAEQRVRELRRQLEEMVPSP